MQTVELIVYLFVAIIAGGLIIMTLTGIDWKDTYYRWRGGFENEVRDNGPTPYKVEATDFASELAKRWEWCRFGLDNVSTSLYVTDNATIDRESLVKDLLRVDRCDVIDCRNTSNRLIVNGTLTTPQIINIRCFNNSLIVG
jgi:hypothetical protein